MISSSWVLGWTAAALRRRREGRRLDECLGADVLRHEFGMLAKAIARALDLHDDGVVEEAVQQRGGDHRIAKDLSPLGEAAVRRQDHRALLVAGVRSSSMMIRSPVLTSNVRLG